MPLYLYCLYRNNRRGRRRLEISRLQQVETDIVNLTLSREIIALSIRQAGEQIENSPKQTLTPTELDQIQCSLYIATPDNTDSQSCSICLDTLKNNDLIRTLNCLHVFHKKCVDQWLLNEKKTCPLCLQDSTTCVNFHVPVS
eukprot:UN28806